MGVSLDWVRGVAPVRVEIDREATQALRKQWPLFNQALVARFTESVPLYRVLDLAELSLSQTAQTLPCDAWGANREEVLEWGARLRPERTLYVARLNGEGRVFVHWCPDWVEGSEESFRAPLGCVWAVAPPWSEATVAPMKARARK